MTDEGPTGAPVEPKGPRPGYGWAVGASGFALLSGILGWLSVVISHRTHQTSTNIVWQAMLAGSVAVAIIAILLAVGAWRRHGGIGVARAAAVVAAASIIGSPIGAVLVRPSVAYLRLSAFRSTDGTPLWTATPHLVQANTMTAGAPGTVMLDGASASTFCGGGYPEQAILSTATGRTTSMVETNPSSGPVGQGVLFAESGIGGGSLTADRSPDAKVDVSVSYDTPNGGGIPSVALLATDITSGTVRWKVPVTSAGESPAPISPLWVDTHVVIAASTPEPSVGAVNGFSNQSSPTTAGNPPITLGSGSTVIALDATTGRELWRAAFGPAGDQGSVAAGPAGVAIATANSLELRDLDTGAKLATTSLGGAQEQGSSLGTGFVTTPLVVGDGLVALISSDSELKAYGPSLSPLWGRHLSIHHDVAALQLKVVGSAVYVIDQVDDPTANC